MLKIHRKFASASKMVYDINTLGKEVLEGYYGSDSKSLYIDYLNRNGSSNRNPTHFKPIYDFKKTLDPSGSNRNSSIEISNIGIGSYLGDPLLEDDQKLFVAMEAAINGGINVIDTAANYRYGKSERVIGAALQHMSKTKSLDRKSVFVASKIGYITPDPDFNKSEADQIQSALDFASQYKGKGNDMVNSLSKDDFIGESHAIHPGYIAYQLEQSLKNLNLRTLDLLYLHNVAETRLALLKKPKVFDELKRAFEYLEILREENKIRFYGLATWNCFRAKIEEEGIYLSLQEVCQLAKEIGGETNGFRFVQIPMNLIMHEPFTMEWQKVVLENSKIRMAKIFEAAQYLGINVITSAPLMQKFALQIELPYKKLGLRSNAQAHLQMMRSMPAEALKSTLVGFRSPNHTAEVLDLLKLPPMNNDELIKYIMSLKQQHTS
jgi:aryl-alcohol dehydrogenase-like predicted oxidoreductase